MGSPPNVTVSDHAMTELSLDVSHGVCEDWQPANPAVRLDDGTVSGCFVLPKAEDSAPEKAAGRVIGLAR